MKKTKEDISIRDAVKRLISAGPPVEEALEELAGLVEAFGRGELLRAGVERILAVVLDPDSTPAEKRGAIIGGIAVLVWGLAPVFQVPAELQTEEPPTVLEAERKLRKLSGILGDVRLSVCRATGTVRVAIVGTDLDPNASPECARRIPLSTALSLEEALALAEEDLLSWFPLRAGLEELAGEEGAGLTGRALRTLDGRLLAAFGDEEQASRAVERINRRAQEWGLPDLAPPSLQEKLEAQEIVSDEALLGRPSL